MQLNLVAMAVVLGGDCCSYGHLALAPVIKGVGVATLAVIAQGQRG